MLLSLKTDHSIRLLMYLALQRDQPVTIANLSRQFNAPRISMAKVCKDLENLRLVIDAKDGGDGIRLAVPADQINLRDIAVRLETSFEIMECKSLGCAIVGECKFKDALIEARDAFLQVLSGYTIADLISNETTLVKLLGLNAA